ncbi:MAG: hypothetical protein U0746_03465 [Gemmataceae bacterium]
MRLLPETRRGTWVLAGGLWFVVASWAWWVAPYRLRAHWPASAGIGLIGWLPDGDALLTLHEPAGDGTAPTCYVHRLEVNTGEVRDVAVLPYSVGSSRLSPDGRWLALRCHGGDKHTALLLEVATGRQTVMSETSGVSPTLEEFQQFSFAPDGQRLVYNSGDLEDGRVWVWDLPAGKLAGVVDGPPTGAKGLSPYADVAAGRDAMARRVSRSLLLGHDVEAVFIRGYADTDWRHLCDLTDIRLRGFVGFTDAGEVFTLRGEGRGNYRRNVFNPATGRLLRSDEEYGLPSVERMTPSGAISRWVNDYVFRQVFDRRVETITLNDPYAGTPIATLKSTFRQNTGQPWRYVAPEDGCPFVAVADEEDGIEVWDAPPRQSWRWLAAAWAGTGLIVAAVARWRTRRLARRSASLLGGTIP